MANSQAPTKAPNPSESIINGGFPTTAAADQLGESGDGRELFAQVRKFIRETREKPASSTQTRKRVNQRIARFGTHRKTRSGNPLGFAGTWRAARRARVA